MNGRLVSVVMPAHDEEAFIAEALRSVLAQTYRPVEVIVVDDGSHDRTAEIAAAHGVRLLCQEHQGPAAARNAGLAVAAGSYWTIFDADDVMPRERLSRQVAQLERDPQLGMVFGLTEAFVTPGSRVRRTITRCGTTGRFHGTRARCWPAVRCLASSARSTKTAWIARTWNGSPRAKHAGVRAGLGDHLALRYRVHKGNASADPRDKQQAMMAVLRESTRRQRASGSSG